MKATEVKKGMKFLFDVEGYKNIFTIEKVTDKRISWYNGHPQKSSWGKNTLRMTCISLKQFQSGLDKGVYKRVYQIK